MFFLTRKQYDLLVSYFGVDTDAKEAYQQSKHHWCLSGVTVITYDTLLAQCFREVGASKLD